jgi:hypothetical protein
MPLILVLGRLKQEDCKFKDSLGYTERPCLKKLKRQSKAKRKQGREGGRERKEKEKMEKGTNATSGTPLACSLDPCWPLQQSLRCVPMAPTISSFTSLTSLPAGGITTTSLHPISTTRPSTSLAVIFVSPAPTSTWHTVGTRKMFLLHYHLSLLEPIHP